MKQRKQKENIHPAPIPKPDQLYKKTKRRSRSTSEQSLEENLLQNGDGVNEKTHHFILGVAGALTYLPRTFSNRKLIRKLFKLMTGMGRALLEADVAKTKGETRRQMNIAKKCASETNFRLSIIADMKLLPKRTITILIGQCKEIANSLSKLVKKQ